MPVTVQQAMTMVRAIHAHATSLNIAVTAVVMDEGARIVALGRMDKARPMTLEIAMDKAYTAVNFQQPTRELAAVAGESWFHSLAVATQGKVMAGAGAVPIVNGDRILGAIAVAGGTDEQEEQSCQVALKTLD